MLTFWGTAGAVDCETIALKAPMPAALVALTAKEYSRPPDKPDATAVLTVLA
jgi:hypothetical protein